MPLIPIYFDTETTGVRSEQDRIVEIAAFDPTNQRTFVQLIHPQIPIPREASAIHRITDEMVAGAASFEKVGADFLSFCPENSVLIAHNADSFDRPFLEAECRRAGLPLPSFPYIDSLKWSRRYRSDLPRHTLQSLREVYGFAANQAHRALDDVLVLHQVFSAMVDDLPMETILELLSRPQTVGRMPFGKYQGKALSEVPKSYTQWLASSGAFDKAENTPLKQAFLDLGHSL